MKTIWKYALKIIDEQWLELPEGAEILAVQMQNEYPQLWAIVNPEMPKKKRHIRIHGTGHKVSNEGNLKYISTFQMKGETLVFHVFENLGL